MNHQETYDCIIIGAGPGGLQAAVHLCRYNRSVLLLDRGGGRTSHARQIVNYLGLPEINGLDLIDTGIDQARSFGAHYQKATVTRITRGSHFMVETKENSYSCHYVIASTGARDNQPRIKNLGSHFGSSYFTCVDCDGHHTTGKKLLVMGNNLNAARLALGMKQMYTRDITLLIDEFSLPGDYADAVREENISIITGSPVELVGNDVLSGVRLADGGIIECEAIMASFGWSLNDSYLADLPIDRDAENFKILAGNSGESSIRGLYVVGALRPGHSQAIIAAGQGAVAAIDINSRLLMI